jgi:signal peptidase I
LKKFIKIEKIRNKNKLILLFFVYPLFFLILFNTKFVFPKSNSLEGKVFFSFPSLFDFQRHQLVVFDKNLKILGGKVNILKEVVGLPGDKIIIKKNIMWVNNIKVGEILPKTRLGKMLSPNQEKIVPKDHLFVRGTNKFSFDSRYEEFGFVPFKDIQKKAVRLW